MIEIEPNDHFGLAMAIEGLPVNDQRAAGKIR